jgi:hypothetical protein
MPAIANNIDKKLVNEIFSFRKKYPKSAKNTVCVLIINTTLATVVDVIAKVYATKLRDRKKPPTIAGKPESPKILKVSFL